MFDFYTQLKKQIEDNVAGWLDIIPGRIPMFQLCLPYKTNFRKAEKWL